MIIEQSRRVGGRSLPCVRVREDLLGGGGVAVLDDDVGARQVADSLHREPGDGRVVHGGVAHQQGLQGLGWEEEGRQGQSVQEVVPRGQKELPNGKTKELPI